MGKASRAVDTRHPPVLGTLFPWHFDHPPGSSSRENIFLKYMALAIAEGGTFSPYGDCIKSARLLGTGLHPKQDAYAHGEATPWEHGFLVIFGVRANAEHIDDIEQDTDWKVVSRHWVHPRWRWTNAGRKSARAFRWWSGGSRIEETKEATKSAVSQWLMRTCCGETVPD